MEKSVVIGNDHPMNVAIVDPATVGHYTGKTDDSKKGKPIFSGDIVSCRSCRVNKTLGQKKLGVIEYDEDSASFVIRTSDRMSLLGSNSLDCTIVVLGNRIDSPNLLKRINNGTDNKRR